MIDGLDIASVPRDLVRSRIVGVVEEPFFFPGSVRHNLDPRGTSTDAQITQALVDTNIWALFEKGGLDAELVKEQLSHGQRQLFSIARALLRDAKVYIFDEASSRYVDDLRRKTNPMSQAQSSGLLIQFLH